MFTTRSIILGIALLLAASPAFAQNAPRNNARDPRQKHVDAAIVRALEFLAREQMAEGCWKIDSYGESTSATSLAIMSFLAAGHVPGEGPYGDQINRGIRWVLDHQLPNGMIVHRRSHGPMYCHGISTLMLAEVVGMCDKQLARDVRTALQDAVRLILNAQDIPKRDNHAGGWRYQTTSPDSDLSVTGWQLLALRAAKDVGCDVPAEHIEQAVAYVKKCSDPDNRGFGYQSGSGVTPTRSGTGILCLEICGAHHTPEALGAADMLLDRPLQFRDGYFFYGVYYCSIGMFKIGGRHWDETKDHLTNLLLANQAPDGSWLIQGSSETRCGKTYCTAMSVLALAIEYRYLPIYQR